MLIEQAAYFKAELNGFKCSPNNYWLKAEKEVHIFTKLEQKSLQKTFTSLLRPGFDAIKGVLMVPKGIEAMPITASAPSR